MTIQAQLAHAQDRRDQRPNRILAERIVNEGGAEQLQGLVDFFLSKPHKDLQKDCVLTMAWIGEQSPELLIPHIDLLIENFNSEIPRVVWGSMIAMAFCAHLVTDKIYSSLPKILDAMDAGSAVTRDHGYRMLMTLYQREKYQENLFFIALEQIQKAPSNQVGQYAERLIEVLNPIHRKELISVLEEKNAELSNEYHIRRLTKNIKKLYK